MKKTEEKLLEIAAAEKRNNEELERIMNKAKAAQQKAEKHMSFREKSIKAREDKKNAKRNAQGGVFKTLKTVLMGAGAFLVVVAIIAIIGCEMEVDGLKEMFVCQIGKEPPEDRRRLRVAKLMMRGSTARQREDEALGAGFLSTSTISMIPAPVPVQSGD